MTNMVCSDWLKDITNQQEISKASMALMEEAQYEVVNDEGKCMVTEISKDGDDSNKQKRGRSKNSSREFLDIRHHYANKFYVCCCNRKAKLFMCG